MPQCRVNECENDATVEVLLYDVYPDGEVFFEQDHTCGWLCDLHLAENERRARGVREPRGSVIYPFTNQFLSQGFTIYRPLEE